MREQEPIDLEELVNINLAEEEEEELSDEDLERMVEELVDIGDHLMDL